MWCHHRYLLCGRTLRFQCYLWLGFPELLQMGKCFANTTWVKSIRSPKADWTPCSSKHSALVPGTGKDLMLTENVYVWLQDCNSFQWQRRRLWLGKWRAQWRVTPREPIRWERSGTHSSCRSFYSGLSITQEPSSSLFDMQGSQPPLSVPLT